MAEGVILALDQGTTSSRAMAIGLDGAIAASAQEEFPQIFPQSGWVEHDPEAIWRTQRRTAEQTLERLGSRKVAAIGVTNQRETVVVWDRKTGEPIHNAIVWQDRRTADRTKALADAGNEARVADLTGLVLDPYFSASKIAFILDAVPGSRERAKRGELAAGTIDCFLIWRLTGGKVHATDATNASRTSLFDIRTGKWDQGLCDLFGVPMQLLPEVRDSAGDYGVSDIFGPSLPIRGVAGDQQAALVGQACFAAGEVKSTYGTGGFLVLNTGHELKRSKSRLLGTIAYQVAGRRTYALEGSILSAGSTIQWLRDELKIIRDGVHAGELAKSIPDTAGVHLVPAFVGLGAPHWDSNARGAILGLQRGSTIAHIARAALESAAFQTAELLEAMASDGVAPQRLRVDGGMARNDWFLQFMSDILGIEVVRPKNTETTALGAAILAAVGAGEFGSLEEAASIWKLDRKFDPAMPAPERAIRLKGWKEAVGRVKSV
ncbi:MAG TPA: glycerol kinase GlpK [Hyphomonadaceae bacterium]|jgi:glycerol kinase|nr:glycerol kinase GlpK [Hyphomonadaceae bacterium]